jgi:predicted nucleic acid-binding protein
VTNWLIDKSALVRLGSSPDAATWASRIERGLIRITTVTRLEVGYSARSAADLRAGLRQPPVLASVRACLRRGLGLRYGRLRLVEVVRQLRWKPAHLVTIGPGQAEQTMRRGTRSVRQ